jgi:hypothetical protein
MFTVMYKNIQLPIILASMVRRRDLSDFQRMVSKEHRWFKFQLLLVVCTGYTWYTPFNEMLTRRFLLDNTKTIRNDKR